jgi:hypothetical protein
MANDHIEKHIFQLPDSFEAFNEPSEQQQGVQNIEAKDS